MVVVVRGVYGGDDGHDDNEAGQSEVWLVSTIV